LSNVFIHAFTDGRDCDPKSGLAFLKELQKPQNIQHTKIASIIGRYYAMDRDNRWERVKKAYDLIVNGTGEKFATVDEVFAQSYSKNITLNWNRYKIHVQTHIWMQ